MNIPTELKIEVASHLAGEDLANFRLACRSFARAGLSLISRNGLSVMNTTRDTDALLGILQCASIANNTRSLRIFHAEWPICSRSEWETHHLLFGGNSRCGHKSQRPPSSVSDTAFTEYERFIKKQIERRRSDEVETITSLLRSLPNLETVEISSMTDYFWKLAGNKRFRALQKSIWIYPYQSHDISLTLESTLLAIGTGAPRIRNVLARGWVNPEKLYLSGEMSGLSSATKLSVEGFQMCENEQSIKRFLQLFPNLTEASLSFEGWGPAATSLNSVDWPQLKELRLYGMWTSEQEFYEIFTKFSSSLLLFSLNRSALTDGSWKRLFTRIKSVKHLAIVTAWGELYGRSSQETIEVDGEGAKLLERFVQDKASKWPFGSAVGRQSLVA